MRVPRSDEFVVLQCGFGTVVNLLVAAGAVPVCRVDDDVVVCPNWAVLGTYNLLCENLLL